MTETFERGAENCPKCGAYPDEDGGHDCPLDKDPARREADQAEEIAEQAEARAKATEKVAVKVEAQEVKAEKAEAKVEEKAQKAQAKQEEKDRKARHRASDVVAAREARAAEDRLGKARDNDPFGDKGTE